MCSPLRAEIFARQGKVVSADRMAPSERHENPALATTVVAARRSVARILCRRGVTIREVLYSMNVRCVAAPVSPKTKEILTAVKPHNPSISDLPHDHPSSVARQQREKPDPWPPQAAGALKIALLGAHGEHGPRGALGELDQSTLLLRPLSVLCSSHLQAIPRPCGGIEQHLCSPKHHGNIGPQIPFCATRSTRAKRSVDT